MDEFNKRCGYPNWTVSEESLISIVKDQFKLRMTRSDTDPTIVNLSFLRKEALNSFLLLSDVNTVMNIHSEFMRDISQLIDFSRVFENNYCGIPNTEDGRMRLEYECADLVVRFESFLRKCLIRYVSSTIS